MGGIWTSDDVPLALALMFGAEPWQRIDGMGLARQALERAAGRPDRAGLSDRDRVLLANARAWCHAVHADLAPNGRRDDPIILADAANYARLALSLAPQDAEVVTTVALLHLRQGRVSEAVAIAEDAVWRLGSLSDSCRTGRSHGAAVMAVVTLALALAVAGDQIRALSLAASARAIRMAVDLDEVAFAALTGEVAELASRAGEPR